MILQAEEVFLHEENIGKATANETRVLEVVSAQLELRVKHHGGTGVLSNLISNLGSEAKFFDPVVSVKLRECLDAVSFRLRHRKNFRNAVGLMARLGGNPLTQEVSVHAVEQFVLHAILLGPLSFIDLKKQDPPRAPLKAGELFARRYHGACYSGEKKMPTHEQGEDMVMKIAEELLVAVQADRDLARATCGWILMASIQTSQSDCSDADAEESEDSFAIWDVIEDVEHGTGNEVLACKADGATPRLATERLDIFTDYRPTLHEAALALATHLIHGPFQGSVHAKHRFFHRF